MKKKNHAMLFQKTIYILKNSISNLFQIQRGKDYLEWNKWTNSWSSRRKVSCILEDWVIGSREGWRNNMGRNGTNHGLFRQLYLSPGQKSAHTSACMCSQTCKCTNIYLLICAPNLVFELLCALLCAPNLVYVLICALVCAPKLVCSLVCFLFVFSPIT